jgi:hypothetical protein
MTEQSQAILANFSEMDTSENLRKQDGAL